MLQLGAAEGAVLNCLQLRGELYLLQGHTSETAEANEGDAVWYIDMRERALIEAAFHTASNVGDGGGDVDLLEAGAAVEGALEVAYAFWQMDAFETMEYVAPVRVVPLFIKQLVVRHFTRKSGRKVTMTFSNMGVQKPPKALADRIGNYSGFCSTNTIFSTMFGYGDNLTLGVSSAYMNTGVVKNFVRALSESGVDVTVSATEVIK